MLNRCWSGGVVIEPHIALTGTLRRSKTLARLNQGIHEWEDSEQCVPLGIKDSAQKKAFTTSSNDKRPSRCVYNYEDRYEFRRIISDTDLIFDSHFESGNLKAAHRIEVTNNSNTAEYDLDINHDVHSAGHVQWFYFSVSNTRAGMRGAFRKD